MQIAAVQKPETDLPGLSLRLFSEVYHCFDGPVLSIENVDILDGTPLLDIKPYVPDFDDHPADSTGWLEKARGASKTVRSDGRFT